MSVELADGLPRKLALKPGMRLVLIEPPAGYEAALAEAIGGQVVVDPAPGAARTDATLAFATTLADLRRVALVAIGHTIHDGLLWIAYPKGGSGLATDLKRDIVWPLLTELGYRPVSQVAIDPIWSALRFRPIG